MTQADHYSRSPKQHCTGSKASSYNCSSTGSCCRLGATSWWRTSTFADASGLTGREGFAHLLVPLVIVYLWLVGVGHLMVMRGYRSLVEAGHRAAGSTAYSRLTWPARSNWPITSKRYQVALIAGDYHALHPHSGAYFFSQRHDAESEQT